MSTNGSMLIDFADGYEVAPDAGLIRQNKTQNLSFI